MSSFLRLVLTVIVAVIVVSGLSYFRWFPMSSAKTPPSRSNSENEGSETSETVVPPEHTSDSREVSSTQKTVPARKNFSGKRSDSRREPNPARSIAEAKDGVFGVKRVVDGDTLMIDGSKLYGHFRLRLTGIDTPETVKEDTPVQPFGPEATAYTKRRIAENGDRVYLEFGTEKADQYGRGLAFVWLDDRTSLLNEELVREGLAKVLLWYEYSPEIKKRLKDAQDDAKRNGRGMWASKKP